MYRKATGLWCVQMGIIWKSPREDVVLFHRGDNPKVYCRILKPGGHGWHQRSTKSRDVDEARAIAEEWRDEMRFRLRHGLVLEPKTFAAVAELYCQTLRDEVALGVRNGRHLKDYLPVVERYLKPYFGNREIDSISNRDIIDYLKWRRAYWIDGPGTEQAFIEYQRNGRTIRRPAPKPKYLSQSAIIGENVVLRGIFKTALKHDLIKEFQVPAIETPKRKSIGKEALDRRPAFTYEEYLKLSQFMREWVGFTGNWKRRDLLRWFVEILTHSGMRPGTETNGLRWCDIKKFDEKERKLADELSEPIPTTLTFEKWLEPL